MAINVEKTECGIEERLDPRVRRTRKLLEDSLGELMRERAFEDISVGEITARAMVNRATFYSHFRDKHELAGSLLRRNLHEAVFSKVPPRAEFNSANLHKFTVAVFEWISGVLLACPRRGRVIVTDIGPSLVEKVQEMLNGWLDADPAAMRFFPDSSSGTTSTVLAWSLYGSGLRWTLRGQKTPVIDAAAEVVALLVRDRT